MANLTNNSFVINSDTSKVCDSAEVKLGSRALDTNGNEYVYLKGVATTAVGAVVVYDENYDTLLASTTNKLGDIAVAMAAVVANKYGWYMVKGSYSAVLCESGTAADNPAHLSNGTAGLIETTSSGAGTQIYGMIARTSESSGKCTCQLNYPHALGVAPV